MQNNHNKEKFYNKLNQNRLNWIYLLMAFIATGIPSIGFTYIGLIMSVQTLDTDSNTLIFYILSFYLINVFFLFIFFFLFAIILNTTIYIFLKLLKYPIKYIQLTNLSFLGYSLVALISPFLLIPPLGILLYIIIFFIIFNLFGKILFELCQFRKLYSYMVLILSIILSFNLYSITLLVILNFFSILILVS